MSDYRVPTMITVDEVSERTGLTKRFIRECVKEDKVVYIMVGRKILVNFEKFIDFLNGDLVHNSEDNLKLVENTDSKILKKEDRRVKKNANINRGTRNSSRASYVWCV